MICSPRFDFSRNLSAQPVPQQVRLAELRNDEGTNSHAATTPQFRVMFNLSENHCDGPGVKALCVTMVKFNDTIGMLFVSLYLR